MDLTRYSRNLQYVLAKSKEIAQALGITYIGSEHIVYSMLDTPECLANKILRENGVVPKSYWNYLLRSVDHDCRINGLTPRTKHMLEQAVEIAMYYEAEDGLAGTEHLLRAVIDSPDCLAMHIFRALGVDLPELSSELNHYLTGESEDDDEEDFSSKDPLFKMFSSGETHGNKRSGAKKEEGKNLSALPQDILQYGTDLTLKAKEGKIDPVIGRKKEIDKIIQVLSRRTKNNPVLIGEPGVGKSAVVEGLAQAIV